MIQYYLLRIEGDTEPELFGPHASDEERTARARDLRQNDPEGRNGLFKLNVHGDPRTVVTVDSYGSADLFSDYCDAERCRHRHLSSTPTRRRREL